MNGSNFELLIGASEAASLLGGIHPKTLQAMAREGRVPAIRIEKFWRFRKSDLDAWVRAGSGVDCRRYAYRPNEEKSE
jgi:excisionase family DNA binding protein